MPSPAGRATAATYAGLFLVALATLMYEILLTRIFSVTMWYHFAVVAISLAMFGMTVGALIVYLASPWFPPSAVRRQLAVYGVLLPIAIVFSFLTQLSIPFRIHPSIVAVYSVLLTYAVSALPFVASGICVSLVLTRFPAEVGLLYAADLAGAALGCVLLIYTLEITDGPTAVIVVAFVAALGAVAFAYDQDRRTLRRGAVLVAGFLGLFAASHTVLVWKQTPILRILYVKGGFEARPLYEKWNSYSRLRVHGDANRLERPYAWGLSATYPADRLVRQLHMNIDASAGTVLTRWTGDPREIEHLAFDVTNVGHHLKPRARALLVGAGGGRDILSALALGARSVVAVELNPDIIRTANERFGDFTGHLDQDPRVTFVNEEARSYVAAHDQRYDIIQMSLVDTWAATAAGAFILTENSLYTVEAWEIFLRRLTDGGVLSVSRWYFRDQPGEIYRLTSLASTALKGLGVTNPRANMVIIRNMRSSGRADLPDGVGTILVGRAPFHRSDLDRLSDVCRRLEFEVVLSPDIVIDETFSRLASGEDLDRFTATFPINVAAPTDDSPFFFHMLRLRQLSRTDLLRMGKSSHNMEAVFVLGGLLTAIAILTAVCAALPFAFASRGAPPEAWPLLTFFAAIGLGFMLIEISLMQRLIIVLGHPTYGLSVVLFGLLLSSGIGSALTPRVADPGKSGIRRLAVLLSVLVLFGAFTPALLRLSEGSSTTVRILAAVAVLSPPGLLMGMAFPLGMRIASSRSLELTPWLWGMNGATSVLGSVLAVAIALTWTISAAFWTGCLAYAIALAAFTAGARQRSVAASAA